MITVLTIGQEKESRVGWNGGENLGPKCTSPKRRRRERERGMGVRKRVRENAPLSGSVSTPGTAGQVGDDGPGVPGGRGLRTEPLMTVGGFNIL